MSRLLKEAIAKAKKLPEWEQDALAAMILDEIEDNQDWKKAKGTEAGDMVVKLLNEALLERM